jgi:hypothetical protein
MKTIQDYYLDLLAAWGDSPSDEEEVKNILHRIIKDTVTIRTALKDKVE